MLLAHEKIIVFARGKLFSGDGSIHHLCMPWRVVAIETQPGPTEPIQPSAILAMSCENAIHAYLAAVCDHIVLKLDGLVVVHAGAESYPLAPRIRAVALARLAVDVPRLT